MREYSKILPQFWLGSTGKKLRGHQEAQIVAFYLLTTPHANMIGLYYLPKIFISHETGLTMQGASKGLQRCIEAGFCRYDEENEMVWVVEMAIHQIGELKATDNRCIGIQNEYDRLPESLYFQEFYEKYASIFHMKKQRGNTSPLQAPSDTLRSQEQEQEQEQEQDYFESFWSEYPNKTAKQAAIKAWQKLKPSDSLFNLMMAALKKQKPYFKIGFIPHPATWLNGRRWEDDIQTCEQSNRKTPKPDDFANKDYSKGINEDGSF